MVTVFAQRKLKVKDFQDAVRSRLPQKPQAHPIPDGLFEICPGCGDRQLSEDLIANLWVCGNCRHHLRISARKRLALLADPGSFKEISGGLVSTDPLEMPGYKQKLDNLYRQGLEEAVICGTALIKGVPFAIGVMDSHFLMGSMGEATGKKITGLTELATEKRLPLLLVTASGGARMQEGILSLMQMANTVAAVKKHHEAGLLYISLLTDPTYGGVSASFATIADVILSEPGTMVGFAGPRVIKQTLKQVLPKGFQSAEFLLEKGQVDLLVQRQDLSGTISRLAQIHGFGRSC